MNRLLATVSLLGLLAGSIVACDMDRSRGSMSGSSSGDASTMSSPTDDMRSRPMETMPQRGGSYGRY
jgi:hypothetical protein